MKKLILILCAFMGFSTSLNAQCSSVNTAFKSGETLAYDLYFNWKFIWVKVGTATMSTMESVWKGQPCYRTFLMTKGNSRADKLFIMRDTLTTYVTHDIVPLYYTKHAREGKHYTVDKVNYSYSGGMCHIDQRRIYDDGEIKTDKSSTKYCVYDMVSMLLRARSFDASHFQKGKRIQFYMADGKRINSEQIVYRGKENFTIEGTSQTYRCLVFSFIEKKNGKERDVVKFYVTDDANHLPVRLDLNLSFGTAKAYLRTATGIRNPQTALIKK